MQETTNSSSRTLIVLATYNELENLPALVDEIRRYALDADILVIDDNSPDGTGLWCDRRAREAGAHRHPEDPALVGHGAPLVMSLRR